MSFSQKALNFSGLKSSSASGNEGINPSMGIFAPLSSGNSPGLIWYMAFMLLIMSKGLGKYILPSRTGKLPFTGIFLRASRVSLLSGFSLSFHITVLTAPAITVFVSQLRECIGLPAPNCLASREINGSRGLILYFNIITALFVFSLNHS